MTDVKPGSAPAPAPMSINPELSAECAHTAYHAAIAVLDDERYAGKVDIYVPLTVAVTLIVAWARIAGVQSIDGLVIGISKQVRRAWAAELAARAKP